ncbi:MAG TPA: hypothetical protein EYP36_07470 [Calditrichaeota bacterium]|nr:hypothetical protein [Calditrichota bacterium]
MPHYLNSFKARHNGITQTDRLDRKLIELSALFEISQTLNSSLNLKSVLDTILLVPMGRMMISRGIVLFEESKYDYKIVSVKGLPLSLIDKTIHINNPPQHPMMLDTQNQKDDWVRVLQEYKIGLLIPLISNKNFRGLFGLGQKLTKEEFLQDEIEFLSSLANIAVQSLENARNYEELNRVNRHLDQKIQELNTLFEIGKELNRIFDQQDILKQVSYSLMGQLLINQFFVALKEEGRLKIIYRKGARFDEEKLSHFTEWCDSLPEVPKPVKLEPDNESFRSCYELGIRLIVPLSIQEKNEGYIFIGNKMNRQDFSVSEMDFLATLGNMIIISLENARLFQETLEKKRLEEELNMARNIQEKLLPAIMPDIKGYDVHGLNLPSKQVGGDYFDIIPLNENECLFTIADVSGKGMPASLLMSNLQAALQTLATEQYSLSQITGKLNNLIFTNTSIDKFITFFILKLHLPSGKYEFVNAGHNPPYHFRQDGQYKTLDDGGIILGMMPDVIYETGSGQMRLNDGIIMFTDGVTEAMDAEEREFEEKRLIHFLKKNFQIFRSEELNKCLIDQLEKFTGGTLTKSDDVTILTLKRER